MLASIRRYGRAIALFLLMTILPGLFPTPSYALTSGPSQPETQQFAPAGMDNMVDPFTGDFSYNIPLLDVGGYPVNINYAAGITPDQESSWVGLGWNLNVGAVNRSVRGIPDDFAGEEIKTSYKVRPNQTFGLTFSPPAGGRELGTFKLKLDNNFNLFYNTYNGFGFSYSLSPSFDLALKNKTDSPYSLGLTGSLGLSVGSEDGVGITPRVGLKTKHTKNNTESTLNASIGFPFSSREGAKGMSLAASFNQTTSHSVTTTKGSETYTERLGSHNSSLSKSSFKGFAAPSYTTHIEHDMYTVNATLSVAPERLRNVLQDETIVMLGGYYNGQFARGDEDRNPSYGYMYEGLTNDPAAVLDFNREKDQGYNEYTTNMPVTSHTYDIFSVQGEGVSGTYRPFRTDVGIVGDNESNSDVVSPDLALNGGFTAVDVATLTDVKLGIDFKYVQSDASAGRWQHPGVQQKRAPYDTENSDVQNIYFARIGDMTPENEPDYYKDVLLGDEVYEYRVLGGGLTGEYQKKDKVTNGVFPKQGTGNDFRYRQSRRNRTGSFTWLTAAQADRYALAPIYSYGAVAQNSDPQKPDFQKYSTTEIKRLTEKGRKGHHISEIRVTNESGSRYVYGMPVYNTEQEDVTFSAKTSSSNIGNARSSGLVDYNPDTDASLNNRNGLEQYYKRTTLQPYATSFLLTYILSSDYVDSDNIPGPSDGDLGTYVKFNYTKTSGDYKWRTPFEENKANFADGLAGKRDDDKASYSHGSKEVFFLHSIETRTHLAIFHLKDRQDGLGTKNQHGGIGHTDFGKVPASQRLKCLDKIVLYAKGDNTSAQPELLKTVHFKYDYSLCPNTPNSLAPGKGKLTLKQIWFTYGLSNKGVLNPYKFEYADPDFDGQTETNFAYNSKDYDRWGNYKQQQPGVGNEAFPYTLQDKALSDLYAGAYALTRIKTPTGGEMRVHYESDDYGFVQNKGAMRMFKILGVSTSKTGLSSNPETLYGDGTGLDGKPFLHIDLGEGFELPSGQNAADYFKKHYLSDISELQYRAKIKVHADFPEELVTGYCLFDKSETHILSGVESNGKIRYTTAVLKLEPESINRRGKDIHPFVKNGWLYANLQYNRELMGSGEVNGNSNGFLQVLEAIAKSTQHILSFVTGFKTFMRIRNHGKTFIPSESYVRLYEHDRIKLGGGHRVKAIVMLDRWKEMLSDREENSSLPFKELAGYGQIYDYSIPEDPANPASRLISSGVAAYEPIIGGEENPWRQLVKTTERIPMAPDREYYSETPYGESFFPAPSVGYRKVRTTPVKVTGSDYSLAGLASNGTGYVEHEFYTAYDFPTFVSQTDLDPYRDHSSQTNPLKIKSFDYVFCSQGYLIELNDMHGKAKSVRVMPDDPTGKAAPVSYVTYHYKVNANDPGRLDNHVPLVDRTLAVRTTQGRQIGVTVDVVNDTRYYSSKTSGGGADINAKLSFSKPPFVIIPQITVFPDVNFERVDFSSITTTKVVNRYGILVKTVAHDNGQAVTTENMAWDEMTGEVLLTRVQNEFFNSIYNFTYPAHWAYREEGMDMAFRNEGLRFTSLESVASRLRDGDEIVCRTRENSYIYTYLHKQGSTLNLLDKKGKKVTSFISAIVVRSGGRNLATTPVATVSTLKNPLINNKISFDAARVLQAGATEYKFVWKGFCNCGEQNEEDKNPFITGERGQLRPWKSWVYLTERVQTGRDGELNVRDDGYYTDYNDFWRVSDGIVPFYKVPGLAHFKWQYVTEIENYNPNGMEIENRDALNRYSMAQFGYARNLPVATSNNSRYQETGFDGFEDYIYENCNDDHFSWRVRSKDAGYGLTEAESHTGRQSFRIPAGGSSGIIKIIDPCSE